MFGLNKSKKDETSTPEIIKGGFDNPLSNPNDDRLGRRKIINQIYPYLTNLDPSWSVRVGLLAPWGEGKSTICKWVAKQAIEDGHIPVWFSPWSANSVAQLWLGFYTALTKALEQYEPARKASALVRIKHWSAEMLAKDWINSVSQFHQYGQSGIQVIQSLLQMSEKDIHALNTAVDGKRFIVILDDLDRVDPILVPQLLMTLRDILDLPGFSFLLPFDHLMVSGALCQYNETPGFGEEFLEKILDYRVYLDQPTSEQIKDFFQEELRLRCPFIPYKSVTAIEEFVPSNPRKLKSLVRSMLVFEKEAARHRDEEIDWKALFFAQMLKLESEAFFLLYAKSTFIDLSKDGAVGHPWISAAVDQNREAAKQAEIDRINNLMNQAQVIAAHKRERLLAICEGWRAAYSWYGHERIAYALRLLSQSEALTWGEFDQVWDAWLKNQDFSAVREWLTEHATKTKKSKAAIVDEFLKAIIGTYDEHLEKASSVMLSVEHQSHIDEARKVLALLEKIIWTEIEGVPKERIFTVANFEALTGAFAKWAHFKGNQSDINLRLEEIELLKRWIAEANAQGRANEYYPLLSKFSAGFDEDRPLVRLYEELLVLLDQNMYLAALSSLSSKDGLNEIYPDGTGEGIKRFLLDADSQMWTPLGTSPAEQILATARHTPAVQKNARILLDLIQRAANRGTRQLTTNEVRKLFQQPAVIVAIWNAAIASPLQFRRLKETRDVRDYLIAQGIPAAQLATPDWLMAVAADNGAHNGAFG